MKKELLDALKAKFPGVSDNILGRIANKLAKTATTAEQVKTAVEGVTIQQILESYGDSRATEAAETARENAVKDYETRYGLKDGVKTGSSTTTTTGGEPQTGSTATTTTGGEEEKIPAWAQKLMNDINEMKTSKATETRTQQLNAVIGKLPEQMRKAYERIPVDKYSEEEFSKLLDEITTEVDGIADETAAQGGAFGKPSANNGGSTKTELSEAQIAAISRREGSVSADKQPF